MCVGKTGSGKTQAGIWQLSLRSYDTMPWVVVDFKGDSLIAEIPGAKETTFDVVPSEPGIYILRALPDDSDALDDFFMRVWARENVGLYIDEGYMIGNGKGDSRAFRALLTQGRSKRIPMIILSQRPAWLSRFCFSEADFFQIFWLNDREDRKRIGQFVPYDIDQRLPEYYSSWYNVSKDQLLTLRPVPAAGNILATFRERMPQAAENQTTKPRRRAI